MRAHNRILIRLALLSSAFFGGWVLTAIALQHRPGEGLYNLFFIGALLLAIASFEATTSLLRLIQNASGATIFLSGIGVLMVMMFGLMLAVILVPARLLTLAVQYLVARHMASSRDTRES